MAISRLLWHCIYEMKKVRFAVTANKYVVPYGHSDYTLYLSGIWVCCKYGHLSSSEMSFIHLWLQPCVNMKVFQRFPWNMLSAADEQDLCYCWCSTTDILWKYHWHIWQKYHYHYYAFIDFGATCEKAAAAAGAALQFCVWFIVAGMRGIIWATCQQKKQWIPMWRN